MELKVCKQCNIEKPLTHYVKSEKWYKNRCKECSNKNAQEAKKFFKESLNSGIFDGLFKICNTCQGNLELKFFPIKERGFDSKCYECANKSFKQGIIDNPERRKRYNETSYRIRRENPEKYLEVDRRYRAKNKDKINKYRRDYSKINSDKVSLYRRKRFATKLSAVPRWANTELDKFRVNEIYELRILRTELTGIIWEVDHIVPLQSELVCGLHCADNLQLITATENRSKGNRHWPDMP